MEEYTINILLIGEQKMPNEKNDSRKQGAFLKIVVLMLAILVFMRYVTYFFPAGQLFTLLPISILFAGLAALGTTILFKEVYGLYQTNKRRSLLLRIRNLIFMPQKYVVGYKSRSYDLCELARAAESIKKCRANVARAAGLLRKKRLNESLTLYEKILTDLEREIVSLSNPLAILYVADMLIETGQRLVETVTIFIPEKVNAAEYREALAMARSFYNSATLLKERLNFYMLNDEKIGAELKEVIEEKVSEVEELIESIPVEAVL